MIDTIRIRLLAASAILAALGATGSATAATPAFTPFVTDFPRASSRPPAGFIPFVTDFGLSPRASGGTFVVGSGAVPNAARESRLDWGDVGLGAGLGAAVASLVAAAAVGVGRRRSSRPLGSARARTAG
jgi:hypothetical protein